MNRYNLTDRQKELLRKLIKYVEERRLREPITLVGTDQGYFIPLRGGGSFEHQGDLIGDLDALCDAGLISARYGAKGTKFYNIRQASYDAVDNDFEVPLMLEQKQPETQRHLERLLDQHKRNIQRLEEVKTLKGLDTPVSVLNELDYEREEMARIKQMLLEIKETPPDDVVIQVEAASDSAVAMGPTVIPVPDFRSALSQELDGVREAIAELTSKFETITMPQAAIASIFGDVDIQPEEDLCFVLMPFGDDMLQQVYEIHVKPTVERVGLQCKRVDDMLGPAAIMEDIWKGINSARVVLAELTGQNPNVFYELGLCHAIGKDAILLAQDIKWVPFDVRHRRTIIYTPTPRGCKQLEEVLGETLEAILGKTPAE